MKKIDLVGDVYGRLTVVEEVDKLGNSRMWSCDCECGENTVVSGGHLRDGNTKSCGCLGRELAAGRIKERSATHGMTSTPEYRSWNSMKMRCSNPTDSSYADYGGRGIKVCDKWLNSFEDFYSAMGSRPEGTSVDRIDNDGDYESSNCRWSTMKEQMNNKRNNHLLTYNGITETITKWADKVGIKRNVLYLRINRYGWSIEKALTTPVRGAA